MQNFSYLDDVLINDDLINASLIFKDQRYSVDESRHQGESVMVKSKRYEITPIRRMEIKRELNDVFKTNFDLIGRKNYDIILS